VDPVISIVTPSFNQGEFLPETILSVLGQRYSRLEYVIMDGGSSDQSPEIIQRFADELHHWQSGPDKGQSSAINAGFAKCSGKVLGWLNSDDFYLPGVLHEVSKLLDPAKAQILAGNCVTIDPTSHRASYSSVPEKLGKYDLTLWDYIIQPSTFFTRPAWQLIGPLDEELHYTFDWDWFIRAKRAGVEFLGSERCLSAYRIHSAHKSSSGATERRQELAAIYERYHGKRLKEAFEECAIHRAQILKLRSRLKKWRLSGFEDLLLRLRFPTCFRGTTEQHREHLLAMI
jgi:glycosyltransferase involved in cell wall biosynthesis